MGIIVAFMFLIGAVVSVGVLIGCYLYCRKLDAAGENRNVDVMGYFSVGFLLAGIISCWILNQWGGDGAPDGGDYGRMFLGALLVALGPGIGAVVGCSVVKNRNK